MTAKPYVISGGWFSEVYGHPVRRQDMTYLDHTRYNAGHAIGPFWHYQAGCGSNLKGTMDARGYAICSFSVDLDAVIWQYLPVDYAAHHAYDASYRYSGVEHAALPGTCELSDAQLTASAALFAAIVAYEKNAHGYTVPVARVTGCEINKAGIKQHADGIGCSWNPKTHTDGLYRWTWDRYMDTMRGFLAGEEDDMTEDQANQLQGTYDFVRNLVRGINGSGAPGAEASDQASNGYKAGQAIKGIRQWQTGFADQRAGKPKPTDPDAAQGWQAAKNT